MPARLHVHIHPFIRTVCVCVYVCRRTYSTCSPECVHLSFIRVPLCVCRCASSTCVSSVGCESWTPRTLISSWHSEVNTYIQMWHLSPPLSSLIQYSTHLSCRWYVSAHPMAFQSWSRIVRSKSLLFIVPLRISTYATMRLCRRR